MTTEIVSICYPKNATGIPAYGDPGLSYVTSYLWTGYLVVVEDGKPIGHIHPDGYFVRLSNRSSFSNKCNLYLGGHSEKDLRRRMKKIIKTYAKDRCHPQRRPEPTIERTELPPC